MVKLLQSFEYQTDISLTLYNGKKGIHCQECCVAGSPDNLTDVPNAVAWAPIENMRNSINKTT